MSGDAQKALLIIVVVFLLGVLTGWGISNFTIVPR